MQIWQTNAARSAAANEERAAAAQPGSGSTPPPAADPGPGGTPPPEVVEAYRQAVRDSLTRSTSGGPTWAQSTGQAQPRQATSPTYFAKRLDQMTQAELADHCRSLTESIQRLAALDAPTAADEDEFDRLSDRFESAMRMREALEMRDRLRSGMETGTVSYEAGARFGGRSAPAARTADGRDLALRSDETVAQWGLRTGRAPALADDGGLSFDRVIRGLATGDWTGADGEARAMAESPLTAGGYLVPAPLAATLIDRARAQTQVIQLGATIVPMASATLKVPRMASGLSPEWRTEGGQINDKNITIDAVTLTAQSLDCMVKVSWELLEDSDQVEGVIAHEFAAAFAEKWDAVALRGSGVAPEPRGLRNTSGITVTPLGANGAALTSWDWLIDAMTTVRTAGYEPTGALYAPRTAGALAKLRESGGGTGAYLAQPTEVQALRKATSTAVPINLTQGTANGVASEAYVGAWPSLLLGVRTNLRIKLLEERFADTGQVAFLAHFRGDIAVAQPAAFNVITGVL